MTSSTSARRTGVAWAQTGEAAPRARTNRGRTERGRGMGKGAGRARPGERGRTGAPRRRIGIRLACIQPGLFGQSGMKLRPAFLLLALAACRAGAAAPPAFPVSVQVDAGRDLGPMKPIWRFFGADEPNYATMKDGKKLLSELGSLRPGEVFFRAHNLLNTGDGSPAYKWGSTNAYTEDAAGKPVYDWTI